MSLLLFSPQVSCHRSGHCSGESPWIRLAQPSPSPQRQSPSLGQWRYWLQGHGPRGQRDGFAPWRQSALPRKDLGGLLTSRPAVRRAGSCPGDGGPWPVRPSYGPGRRHRSPCQGGSAMRFHEPTPRVNSARETSHLTESLSLPRSASSKIQITGPT